MKLRCVVEGHGEVAALPILLRRIAQERCGIHVDVRQPFRVPRHTIVKPGELERAVRLSARQAAPDGAVIVVLDADDDCPATLGPALLARARNSSEGRPVIVVLAEREYEGWLLAAARSLRGQRGLPTDLVPPESADTLRNAKGWLGERMGGGYRATLDQPALTASVSLDEALDAPSFAKLVRDLETLLRPT
jgi:hypothetical protein